MRSSSSEPTAAKESEVPFLTSEISSPSQSSSPSKLRDRFPVPSMENLVSLILHTGLLVFHLALLVVYFKHWEHRAIFALDKQRLISLVVTISATALGTIYSAALVFLTQSLSTQHHLRRRQTLTATHDNLAAWTGMGSAIVALWGQRKITASVLGVLSTATYLACILVLHITTPALISVDAFNTTSLMNVSTTGLPFISHDHVNFTNINNLNFWVYAGVKGALGSTPFFVGSRPTIGRLGNTIYEIPETKLGTGTARVPATTINIECGFIPNVEASLNTTTNRTWSTNLPSSTGVNHSFPVSNNNVISSLFLTEIGIGESASYNFASPDRYFYSNIPIYDSTGTFSSILHLSYPSQKLGTIIPISFQIFRCWHEIANNTAVVSIPDGEVVSILSEGDRYQKEAFWREYDESRSYREPPDVVLGNTDLLQDPYGFMNLWGLWYSLSPLSQVMRTSEFADVIPPLSILDVGLMAGLELLDMGPMNLSLVDLQNTLSSVVAGMIWTLAHSAPAPAYAGTSLAGLADPQLDGALRLTTLASGETEITEEFVFARLDLSLAAILGGLVASIMITVLSLQFGVFTNMFRRTSALPTATSPRGRGAHEINTFGLLQAMWLFRNNTDLEGLLALVEHPTKMELREAGMVTVSLGDGSGFEDNIPPEA
ncbi:hypothetical protein MKEN_00196800 [Mycena kentingensis (nom. inval.)]|nr:hypothetical protein MKEN_00196800 [Mycena kentingensis (nom. inval.)]